MLRWVWILLGLTLPVEASAMKPLPQPTVMTDSGLVAGVGGNPTVFRGIPYAAPPVGPLRWRPPQPPVKWTGIWDATKFGPACPQAPNSPVMMIGPVGASSEDCLTLNVWKPAGTAAGAKLPVMVWIHGGGFFTGSGRETQFDGTQYVARGVVFVTINYRLGRLGFFAHPALDAENPSELHGNYGLMDQVAALKWVRSNIAAFGGDPGNMTVFGESAGGISILGLMASPLAQGLFQKAIVESGAFPNPMREIAKDQSNRPSAETLGKAFAVEPDFYPIAEAMIETIFQRLADRLPAFRRLLSDDEDAMTAKIEGFFLLQQINYFAVEVATRPWVLDTDKATLILAGRIRDFIRAHAS